MNNGLINFILNILVKIRLRKKRGVGIKMNEVSNFTMKGVRTDAY